MTDQDLLDEYALELGLPKPINVSGLIASHKVLLRSMRALQAMSTKPIAEVAPLLQQAADQIAELQHKLWCAEVNSDGHQEHIAELKRDNAAKQAKIDALMLKYCRDEVTPEQFEEWAKHQRMALEDDAPTDTRGTASALSGIIAVD